MQNKHISEEQGVLFAAANSGRGFYSFYDEIFGNEKIERRYLIKGGPGTGKSSFMRRVAHVCSDNGHNVAYYCCSSDPASLDAVIIDGRIAIIDSTAPHVLEPTLTGVRDEIINLGVFWNSDELFKHKGKVESASREKGNAYSGAYRFLESALALDVRSRELISPFIDTEKMRKSAARMLLQVPRGDRYTLNVGLRASIGMSGRCNADYYEKNAKKIYVIDDYLCGAGWFLSAIAEEAVTRNVGVTVSYDPLNISVPDAIMIENDGTAFISGNVDPDFVEKIAGHINMKRFVRTKLLVGKTGKVVKSELRYVGRVRESLIDSATECLSRAGEVHFELEHIYGKCMDFDAESRFCESFSADLCRKLD